MPHRPGGQPDAAQPEWGQKPLRHGSIFKQTAACSRIDSLPARELQAILSLKPQQMPDDAAIAVRDFIERIGGMENAQMAANLLERVEHGGPLG